MAAQILEQPNLGYLLKALANFVRLPATRLWIDYDTGADVLYVHFEDEPASTHSEMSNEGIILDYRDDELVGLTVLDASMRSQ